ncbi:MAG TPA: protoheme IX farnesyltransferase [Alphaproteobacteria bacterium]|jgi:protoheme IX farnesyltransferase|nr:protoheme IX farnesyltransferase [Rhodospirillaceae bacterium]HBP58768.1 protoheme IX farnesyltransferase [Alphaproteobacteria bacterium]HCA15319.1 protoheme IX farnesyltransferase [Alphaproteobacteria bacterium]HCA92814.1 protoheme IX farnesyltransferase [Alphaproteobacteria bacterium]HCD20741.1 protoheme IX farnesyltransferase [Alphaproteobacteria bacterium]|tara:strand:- start:4506 stop:5441 length:936 start_codon:yes stop_codon:yes gene_type:complete
MAVTSHQSVTGTTDGLYGPSVADFWNLLKPRVMSLVIFTGFAGMFLAPTSIHPMLFIISLFAIAAGAGASGAINQWYDSDIDAVMQRTQNRPIPAGAVEPAEALSFGLIISALSVLVLGLASNWLAAGLLAFTIFFYGVVYTIWLKRSTPQNIVIGGAAGALPPVIGWAAVSGSLSIEPLLLFAIIFMWTPPHFWALALFRNEDYTRAGVPMMPVVAGEAETRRQILIYAVLLAPLGVLPAFIGMSSLLYGAVAAGLGLNFIRLSRALMRSPDDAAARRLFGFSIVYLFLLFLGLVIDRAIMPERFLAGVL